MIWEIAPLILAAIIASAVLAAIIAMLIDLAVSQLVYLLSESGQLIKALKGRRG